MGILIDKQNSQVDASIQTPKMSEMVSNNADINRNGQDHEDQESSDDLRPHERYNIQARIVEVPDELLESSRMNLPPLGHPGNRFIDVNPKRISEIVVRNR